jgi:hypothetical protein
MFADKFSRKRNISVSSLKGEISMQQHDYSLGILSFYTSHIKYSFFHRISGYTCITFSFC